MNKQEWLWLAVIGAVSMASATALARTYTSIFFESLDADADGIVTTVEFEDHAMARWAESDLDHDGKVTAAELHSIDGGTGFHGSEFVRLPGDADGDGAVSEAEAQAEAHLLSTRLDTDDDDALSEQELENGRHVHMRAGDGPPREP